MGKSVFIAEKPSVAREFANALSLPFRQRDGYMETDNTIVTWCVGHLVTMSYPDAYDEKYKKWSLSTIPFIPDEYRYQVIDGVKKQFQIVKGILTSPEVENIYICTDSGREGEYIYRLVAMQAGVRGKNQRRVWIDSQTKEEIIRGIKEAKDDREYDHLGAAAFLRAKEDYLMGINFSRALTLKYGNGIRDYLQMDRCVIAVGRVMTCVLGMVVEREREIRSFVKTPFYRVIGSFCPGARDQGSFDAEWHVQEQSIYANTPALYKENGFKDRKDAENLITHLTKADAQADPPVIQSITRKKENKNPPLLYNLAELQNDCSRFFKISPDETLAAAQELYEKKLTTYPRTDARVLSTAVAKEITKNLRGIGNQSMYQPYVQKILESDAPAKIGKSRYTNDKAITDHYAIIPTGQGERALSSVSPTVAKVYELICRRFLAIFYGPAVYDKLSLQIKVNTEVFGANAKTCRDKGYLEVMEYSFFRKKNAGAGKQATQPEATAQKAETPENDTDENGQDGVDNEQLAKALESLKKGDTLTVKEYSIRDGETSPPKRYNSGSMILAMENAGQFIEEEELREQIKGSGIGTSATRAEILKKLVANRYLALNKKTQIITPTQLGEMIYDTVACSLRPLLNPKLTASWEMGLSRVAEGTVTEEEYMQKLNDFVTRRTNHVKETDYRRQLMSMYRQTAQYYPQKEKAAAKKAGADKASADKASADKVSANKAGQKATGTARGGRTKKKQFTSFVGGKTEGRSL